MNKTIVLLPLAFVLGGMAGFFGPNEELQALKQRQAEEARKPAAKAANGFGSFAQLVNIPDAASMKRRPRPRPTKESNAAAPAADTNAAPEHVVVEAPDAPPEPPKELDPEDLRLRLEEAAELWRTRADMAKAKAIEKLGLDAAGEAGFNDAVAAMNDKLRDSMQTIADLLADQEAMTPELGVRLMGDLSTTLAESYDAVGGVTTEDHRGDVSNLQMIDFIDPMVAEPLIAVQGKLNGPFGMPGGRRR